MESGQYQDVCAMTKIEHLFFLKTNFDLELIYLIKFETKYSVHWIVFIRKKNNIF